MAQHATSAASEQGVTVEQILDEPLLRGCVAGSHSGLDRQVSWCLPWSEVAEAAKRRNDLEGVAVHLPASKLADPDEARTLVASLARRGAPALFAWQRHEAFCDFGPAARAADAAGVALLALPPEADFHRLGRLIATKVLAQSTHVLEYSVRVHRTLGDVFESGAGLPALAQSMSVLTQTPVLLLHPDGEVLAAGTAGRPLDGVALDDVATALVANMAQAGTEADPAGEDATAEHGHTHHGEDTVLTFESRSLHTVVAPVVLAGEAHGLVAIIEPEWPPNDHDLAQHRVVAEQGATLTGSEMLRQRSIREAQERARDDFVHALVHARFADSHELTARARHHGFDTQARFAVYVVTGPSLTTDRRHDMERVLSAARAAGQAARESMLTLAAPLGSMVVVVHQVVEPSPHTDPLEERETVRRFADGLRTHVGDLAGLGARVAFGRGGVGAGGVAESYREARLALELARRVDDRPVCGYEDLRLYAALRDLASSTQGRSFAREILTPLRRADGQTASLEDVVLAYVAESGNLNAAARRLRLHRNTMLYKLDRASRALRMDVRQSETQFMVWLAYHIDTLDSVGRTLDAELSPPS